MLISYELDEFRRNQRPQITHEPGSLFWNNFPFLFNPNPFYNYYSELETFVHLYPDEPLYVHGLIIIPVPVTRHIRHIIYNRFCFNTPDSILLLVRSSRIRFKFLFFYQESRNDIEISNLTVLTHSGGPAFYNEDLDYV